ncbi:MAG: homoserine dehydrogenase [Fimbriimonadales bacterium]|nr:homoserine dehydrogenase [Fimbriimonadales bacterium]
MSKTLHLSILGAGTVGGGVLTLLRENADLLQAQTGKRFAVRRVLVRDLHKPRAVPIDPSLLTTEPQRAVCDPKVDIVLELTGGLEPARSLIRDALQAGKHVITANKLVMAVSGDELIRLAQARGVRLLYEASVAGSLPILNALQGALAGNRIQRVVGIVNSTTNFILREMERAVESGEPAETAYTTALQKAQQLGYAEADPSSDVEGYDAQYKTAILARLAFLQYVPLESVYREGITHLSGRDLYWARRLNMGLKLLSISERLPDGRLCARVHPTLIPRECPLYVVRGAFSGVWLQGNGFQEMSFHGFGAGARATASAVLGDLIEVARHPKPPRYEDPSLRLGETAPIETLTMRYYVRFSAPDEAGLQPVRDALRLLNAEFHPVETLDGSVEQVALTPLLNEGEFRARLHALRHEAAGALQVIRLLS